MADTKMKDYLTKSDNPDLENQDSLPGPLHPTSQDYERLRAHCVALENDRAGLWGVNEELRTKIISLEEGQLDLQNTIKGFEALITAKHDFLLAAYKLIEDYLPDSNTGKARLKICTAMALTLDSIAWPSSDKPLRGKA